MQRPSPWVVLSLAAFSIAGFTADGWAQTSDPVRLAVPRVTRAPQRADFESMELLDAPLGMRRVEGFVQRFPNDGEPVSERTVVYVGYDQDFFYVAFLCFDRERARIGAHMLPRDAFPNDEDTVSVQIDTFRDLKHAYGFQTNALGVQTDGFYTEGQGWDLSWDTVWRSDAALTKGGFVALFRIPFKSLRFPAVDTQQWGIFFYRAIARQNEQVYWPACSTRVAARFRQAALVEGIEQVSPGRNLQGIPYVSARSFRALDVDRTGAATFPPAAVEGGVGIDAKAVVRDSLVVDATVNPDFSQIESDQPQITVNRPFEVFFPEKRPFFLENATYFATPVQLLFTRRVADPMVGARATGRVGRYALGAMVVDDRSQSALPKADGRAWFGVARVMRDVGRESFVGAFTSTRQDGAARNAVGAIDGRAKLGANWFAAGQGVTTLTRNGNQVDDWGSAAFASLVGSGRRFNYELDYNERSPSFHVATGFIPRVDIRSLDQTFAFRARPAGRRLKAWGPDLVVNRSWDTRGEPLDWTVTPRFEWQWPGTTTLDVYYTAGRQTLRPSEIPAARSPLTTEVDRVGVAFTSAILPRVIGAGGWFMGDAPNIAPSPGRAISTERITDVTVSATVRVSHSLMVDTSYILDRLQDAASAAPTYLNRIARVRVNEQFTRAAAVRLIIQYNQLSADSQRSSLQPARNINGDVLFTFLTSPGTAVYVGANSNLADIDRRFLPGVGAGLLRSPTFSNTGWQIFTKMSYLLRP